MVRMVGFLLAGAVLITADWWLLARANLEHRLPWNGWPPQHTWVHRAAVVLAVVCTSLTSTELIDRVGFGVALLIALAALLGPAAVVTVAHNRRVRRS